MNKRAAGFTLLELLLVLVLVGIGTGLAIASVDRLSSRMQEQRWFDRTQQQLQRLRNKAVLSGQPVAAVLDFANGTLSSPATPTLELPAGYQWQPLAAAPRQAGADDAPAPLKLLFLPDGTMHQAQFLLQTPSGLRQEFRLQTISGRIERLPLASAQS